MIPVFQTRFEEEGNCWAACWASLLECSLEEIEYISGVNDDWFEQTNELLAERGLYFVEYKFIPPGFNLSLIPQGELLIGGTISHTGNDHAVIVRVDHHPIPIDDMIQMNFFVVHDPLGRHRPAHFEYKLESLILPIKSYQE